MWKFYLKKVWEFLKRFILFIIIIILVCALVGGIYIGIQDINATRAKKYITDKYGFDTKKFYAIKTTEYVYEKDMKCESLWFKKCTDDESIEKKIEFINFSGKKFIVKAYRDGSFVDNYENKDFEGIKKEEEDKKEEVKEENKESTNN